MERMRSIVFSLWIDNGSFVNKRSVKLSKLFVLFSSVFIFQSSAHALYFYNKTDDDLRYVTGFRKVGTSEIFRELKVEKIAPGGTQKLKFKDSSKARKFLERAEENRENLLKGSALEVVIRIKKLDDSKSENSVVYNGTLCTLESLDHLIRLHDFAHAEFSKNNDVYTLNLTDL